MPGKRTQFINKKNAVTFHLVHRSQRDPLQADEDAPKRVLLPAGTPNDEHLVKRKEEERKFGVFYDDDYDYLQHLKDADELHKVEPVREPSRDASRRLKPADPANVSTDEASEEPKLQLPSSVFASSTETDVGLLNKAAPLRGPQLSWDPDIVAAMDDDFEFEDPDNQLEDDFMVQANQGELEHEDSDVMAAAEGRGDDLEADVFRFYKPPTHRSGQEGDGEEDFASDEAEQLSDDDFGDDDDGFGSPGMANFDDVETKSRFTSYSMTSSVIRRNEGLTLLDDKFEKVYEQYDDEEIGALDQEEIAGRVGGESAILDHVMKEFEDTHREIKMKDAVQKAEGVLNLSDSEEEEDLEKMVVELPGEKWDCESIISTYSNLYNHPKKIEEPKKVKPIQLTKRVGIPAGVLVGRGSSGRLQENDVTDDVGSEVERPCTYRPPDETAEERKARKQAVKEAQRTRREEKKMNKMAFKEEQLRQEKEVQNLRHNLKGVKIT